ncbi:MAG: amphi-Trp domain-containing protein [Methanothrix sp.]|jgi:amphi-Trp domain-containing protein|nr:amphi-Trp domain-containing protein [Methanothrix sp.]HPW73264.1 amphi-Trp domain-containing protein [Methanothrix sp.]
MAELTGTPGKIELKFHSGNGIEEFEQKFALTNTEAAAFFKELAEEIEAGGEVSVRYGSIDISINPEPPIDVEVECEKDGLEIEIKLKARREEEKGEKREKEEKEEKGEEEEKGEKEEKEEKEESSPGRA